MIVGSMNRNENMLRELAAAKPEDHTSQEYSRYVALHAAVRGGGLGGRYNASGTVRLRDSDGLFCVCG